MWEMPFTIVYVTTPNDRYIIESHPFLKESLTLNGLNSIHCQGYNCLLL